MPSTTTSTQSPVSIAPAQPARSAAHKPFSWLEDHLEHDRGARFAAMTMDVCQGIATCLELIHSSNVDRNRGGLPTLNPADTDRLTRLAMASANLLSRAAEDQIELLNQSESKVHK